jgi:hypothetical protein
LLRTGGRAFSLFFHSPSSATFAVATPEETRQGLSMPVGDATKIKQIVIELETPGDSRTMFRLRLDDNVVGKNLTAVQTHLLVGEILDRISIPRRLPDDR